MGRGSRHSKNAGTMGSESMTYAEMKGLGYGTVNERLGKVPDPCWVYPGQCTSAPCHLRSWQAVGVPCNSI